MDIFKEIKEKLKKESKESLSELREIKKNSTECYKDLKSISKPTLILLLYKAIEKIDTLENGGEYDERDWKALLCDKEFIFDHLVDEQIEECELFEE